MQPCCIGEGIAICQGSAVARESLSEDVAQAERQRLRSLLREKGHAVTAQRVAAYDIIIAINDHICAEHILETIQREHPRWRVNKTTIYRTLDLFQELGLIYEMRCDQGRAQYELALHGRHAHLLCSACNEVEDLDLAIATDFRLDLQAQHGFQVDLSNHALMGLCARCASGLAR